MCIDLFHCIKVSQIHKILVSSVILLGTRNYNIINHIYNESSLLYYTEIADVINRDKPSVLSIGKGVKINVIRWI